MTSVEKEIHQRCHKCKVDVWIVVMFFVITTMEAHQVDTFEVASSVYSE